MSTEEKGCVCVCFMNIFLDDLIEEIAFKLGPQS